MKKERSAISLKTQKQLFAHSGNSCAFPGCDSCLVKDGIVLGQLCHIKAASPWGPRYDAEQSETERHSAQNLILLCSNHHKMVDSDPATYTAQKLTEMKASHESGEQILPRAEVNKAIRSTGPTFITNHFYAPVNAVAQGNASIGIAHQTIGVVSHNHNSAFKITVGEIGGYVTTKARSLYAIHRTFNLKLENTDLTRTIQGCKIHLLSTEPSEGYQGPWILGEGVSLAAGDYKFIPFVSYGEARNPATFNCADSFMEVLPATHGHPTLGRDQTHLLHIRVTGIDAAPVELKCQVSVNSKGRLHVEEIRGEILIPLTEAARRAYEHTRGTGMAEMAERHDGTPEGVLEYYAVLIIEYHTILVKKPPSTILESFPKELLSKMSLCDQLKGIKYHGAQRATYSDPHIREEDLEAFLKWTTDQYLTTDQS